jgi:hypothetical protein
MRQPAFMGKHLAKIAHVDPASYRALDEMRGYVLRLAAVAPMYLPRGIALDCIR